MSQRRAGLASLHLFVLLFALSTIPSVLVAYDPSLSVPAFLAIWLGAALYILVVLLARSERSHRVVAVAFLSASTAFAVYIIVQYGHLDFHKGGLLVHLGLLTTLLPDLEGLRPHPNSAASFIEASIPIGVALALTARRTASRVALWATTATVLYALLLTASRGAWLALALAGVMAALLFVALPCIQTSPRRVHLLVGGGVFVVLLLASVLGLFALGSGSPPFVSEPNLLSSTFDRASDRLTLYRNSLYLARDYIFTGAGLGNTFGMVYSRYGLLIYVPFLYYPHNLPLSVWFNQGLLGLISLAGIVLSLCIVVARVTRAGNPSPLFHGAWLGATVALLHGLTDAPQYDPTSPWVMPVLFVALALVASAARLYSLRLTSTSPASSAPAATSPSPASTTPGPPSPASISFPPSPSPASTASTVPTSTAHRSLPSYPLALPIAILILVVMSTLAIAVSYHYLLAAWHTNLGALAETRSDLSPNLSDENLANYCQLAETEYRTALSIDPASSSTQRRLGNLLVRLERFDEAVPYLESALRNEPGNPAALKGLGLAYTWTGRTEQAARLLRQVTAPSDMKAELEYWAFHWSQRQKPLLSAYSLEALSYTHPEATTPADLARIVDFYSQARQPN